MAEVKILQIPPFGPPKEGGSERFCFNLSKILLKMGHEPVIYTAKLPAWTPFYEVYEGIPVRQFPILF